MLQSIFCLPLILGCLVVMTSSSMQESQKNEEFEYIKKQIKLIYSRMKAIEVSNKAVLTEVRSMQALLAKTVGDETASSIKSDVKTTHDNHMNMRGSHRGLSTQTASHNTQDIHVTTTSAGLKKVKSNNFLKQRHALMPQSKNISVIKEDKIDDQESKGNVSNGGQSSENGTLIQNDPRKEKVSRDDCMAHKKGNNSLVMASIAKISVVHLDGSNFRTFFMPSHVISSVYDDMCTLYFTTLRGILKIKIPDYKTQTLLVQHNGQHLGIDTSIQRLFTLTRSCRLKYVDLHTKRVRATKGKPYSKCNIRGIDLVVVSKSRQIFVNNYYRTELKTMDYKGNVFQTQKLSHRTSSMVFAGEYDQLLGVLKHSLVSMLVNDTTHTTTLTRTSHLNWPPNAYFKGTYAAATKLHVEAYTYDGRNMTKISKMKARFARALAIIEE